MALTRALHSQVRDLGLILHIAHLHHGLRGPEADLDQAFAAELAECLGLPFHTQRVDAAAKAEFDPSSGKAKESIEEASRRLRYAWFRQLMASGVVNAVATAHTLDDQAETVLGKFLRGAWTEGISGIHPTLNFPEGQVIRPILNTTRKQVEAYLGAIGQAWREDSSNQDIAYTRNRIRHKLLPDLESWNPQIRNHLASMAELAQGEESWWQSEVLKLAAQLILPGRPVRGGGRAVSHDSSTVSLDAIRIAALPVAYERRLLRHAAGLLGVSLNFEATESLRLLVASGPSTRRLSLPGPITAERTARELRLTLDPIAPAKRGDESTAHNFEIELPIPGEVTAFGYKFRALAPAPTAPAKIRSWRPGDRVTLRYSSGPRKLKEVLARLKVSGNERIIWPVVEWQAQVIWMKGALLEQVADITIMAEKELGSSTGD